MMRIRDMLDGGLVSVSPSGSGVEKKLKSSLENR